MTPAASDLLKRLQKAFPPDFPFPLATARPGMAIKPTHQFVPLSFDEELDEDTLELARPLAYVFTIAGAPAEQVALIVRYEVASFIRFTEEDAAGFGRELGHFIHGALARAEIKARVPIFQFIYKTRFTPNAHIRRVVMNTSPYEYGLRGRLAYLPFDTDSRR